MGTLGGGNKSHATALNNDGQVVGYSYTAADLSNSNAFIYANGTMTDLGQPYGAFTTSGTGINDSGTVVGRGQHSFRYSGGPHHLLPFKIADAYGINSSGQIVGRSTNSQAVLLSNGVTTGLGSLGSGDFTSIAWAINDAGDVVGGSFGNGVDGFGHDAMHAFLYRNGQMADLGSLGGSYCNASAINAAGTMITGYGWTVSYYPGGPSMCYAFLYMNGHMTDLGTFGGQNSWAAGINALDQFVGYADMPSDVEHAFFYSNGQMKDLNGLVDSSATGWVLSEATDINDYGSITGYGITPSGAGARVPPYAAAGTFISRNSWNLHFAQWSERLKGERLKGT